MAIFGITPSLLAGLAGTLGAGAAKVGAGAAAAKIGATAAGVGAGSVGAKTGMLTGLGAKLATGLTTAKGITSAAGGLAGAAHGGMRMKDQLDGPDFQAPAGVGGGPTSTSQWGGGEGGVFGAGSWKERR